MPCALNRARKSNRSSVLLARHPATEGMDSLLDIGCRTGLHFATMQALGYAITGVDLSADQVRIASSRNPNMFVADARALPFPDEAFPNVVMTFVHTDIDGWSQTIAEATRVLQLGGPLCVPRSPSRVRRGIRGSVRRDRYRIGSFRRRLWRRVAASRPIRSVSSPKPRGLTKSHPFDLPERLLSTLGTPGVRLAGEYDTAMSEWTPSAPDKRALPWNVSVTATKVRCQD
jgi:SAM-dependent methyltransferase